MVQPVAGSSGDGRLPLVPKMSRVPASDELTLLPERTSLPRGLSALSEAEVAASQRGRIMQAITEEVAEHGYHACSVQGVIRRAGVSRGRSTAPSPTRRTRFRRRTSLPANSSSI